MSPGAELRRARPDTFAAALDPSYRRHDYARLLGRKFRDLMIPDYAQADHHQIWTMQPQIGKSTAGSVWGPAWALDHDPTTRFILTSYALRLARRNSRNVRNILRNNAAEFRCHLAPDTTAADEFYTTEGGGIVAAGVDGAMTGFSGDVIVIDDPHKNRREANSRHMRDLVWNWWQDDVQGRLQGEERVLLVMTSWHPDDLKGRMLEADPDLWSVTHLPALADPQIVDPDPLGRAPGEPVCEEMFSKAVMEARRENVGPIAWNALYQGSPVVLGGEILDPSEFVLLAAPGDAPVSWSDITITSWDMAGGDDGNSWTVGMVWSKDSVRGKSRYILREVVRGKWNLPEQVRAVKSLAHDWPTASLHLIENASNGRAVIQQLRAERFPGVHPINPGAIGSKTDRAIATQGPLYSGAVFVPGWDHPIVDRFLDEVADFPNGTNDDLVDTYSQALNFLITPLANDDPLTRWATADLSGR